MARKPFPEDYARIEDDKKDTATGEIIIKANPNYKETQEEYEEQFKFLITVREQIFGNTEGNKKYP